MAGACAPSPNTTTVLHSAFIDVTDCGCVCSVRIDGVFYPWCRGGAALAGATPQPRPVLISAGPLTGATSSLPALSSAPAPAYRGSRQQRCERYLGITSSRHHQPQSHALDWVTRSRLFATLSPSYPIDLNEAIHRRYGWHSLKPHRCGPIVANRCGPCVVNRAATLH
jgi:hypothetical protein